MIIWHADIDSIPDEQYADVLNLFPDAIAHDIDRYRNMCDKKGRLIARLLIEKYFTETGFSCDWNKWDYTETKKPFITDRPNFNISHAGQKVIVGFSLHDEIGVDIEENKPIDVASVSSFFHVNEIKYLEDKQFSSNAFFKIWTRKEAVLKAIGIGLLSGLNQINALEESVQFNGEWYLKEIFIDPDYFSCICTNNEQDTVTIKEIDKKSLTHYIHEKILL